MSDNLSPLEQTVLSALEELEAEAEAKATPDFVPVDRIATRSGVSSNDLEDALATICSKRLAIWDKQVGVRSRVGHILHCLRNSEALSRKGPQRNVADLKYIRFVKQVPKLSIPLGEESTQEAIDQVLHFREIEQASFGVVSAAIVALSTRYEKISKFQMNSTLTILKMLQTRGSSEGLVIVADTGTGKSLAYQLPLLIYILTKKLRTYLEGNKLTNCSAMLLFPRVVLARDQRETFLELGKLVGEYLERLDYRLRLPDDLKKFLKFKVATDFGGKSKEAIEEMYGLATGEGPDVIVTNPDTLKRRLLNPTAHRVYTKGIDMVLYDEVHLYSGLFGAYVSGMNGRLKSILPRNSAFVGMSATIAQPEKHCQRLFCLTGRPDMIDDHNEILEKKTVEHHVIVKPRAGRPTLGVAIDATSCLLHNRRDGYAQSRELPIIERPKTISFSDSLDTSGRWVHDQNDLELFVPRETPPAGRYYRGYPVYFEPWFDEVGQACKDCHGGKDVIASHCNYYETGRCWYFSQDKGEQNSWIRLSGGATAFIPRDNMRSRRLTAQEVQLEGDIEVYNLFRNRLFQGATVFDYEDVDNLIATPVLEVGVDFKGIKEIGILGEIQSPATYKQKAGRGAREGNTTDGLFVMTIAPPMPLANFYYRHFFRLVHPTLTPIPLEPANPDIMKSHAFSSVLDYLAKQGIDVFNVININKNEQAVEKQFKDALLFLQNNRNSVEGHTRSFLARLGIIDEGLVKRAWHECLALLKHLTQPIMMQGEEKEFVTWIFKGSRDGQVLRTLEEQLRLRYENLQRSTQSFENFAGRASELLQFLKLMGSQYQGATPELERLVPAT
jgi:DEAD/DEAH box helicase domain-containing protein